MKKVVIIISLCLFASLLQAETHISGDISTISFTPTNNPFVVEQTITIPPNKVAIIEPGCVFLFKPLLD